MTNTDLTARLTAAAMLALAALPIAALSTAAHAETVVKVADLNLATVEGMATFGQRADRASRQYCVGERLASQYAACRSGVRAELAEKAQAILTAQAQSGRAYAAR